MTGTIIVMAALVMVCFILVVRNSMQGIEGAKNAFGIPIKMAIHAVPKANQVGYYDIMRTHLPQYFQRMVDYDPITDGNPAGKWRGRFESGDPEKPNIHMVTVLAYYPVVGNPPNWVVKVAYNSPTRLYNMEMHLTTGPMSPEDFSALYPQLEQDIVNQDSLWESRGF